jgi:competence protein ComGC
MDPDSEFGKSPKKLQIQSNVGPRKNITNLDMQVNYVSVKEDKNSRIEALIPAQQKRKSLADRQKCETLVPIVDHSLASLNIDEKSMTPSLAEEIQEEGRYMAKSQPFLKEHEASNPRTSASDGDIHTNSEGKDDCQLDLNGPDVPGNVQVITTPRTLHCDTISSESLSQQTARSSFDIPLVSLNQGKGVEITAGDHTEALVLPREGFNSSQPDSFYTGKLLFLKRQALNSPDVLSSAEDSYGGAKPKTKNAISSGQPETTLYDDQNSMRAVPVSGVLPSGSNVVYSRNASVMYGSVLDVRTFAQSIPHEGHLQLECIGVLMEDVC